MNAIKQTIKSGKTAIGTTAGPNIDVSVLADAGFDFILFDTQHSPWEIKQMAPSIQAMRGKKAAPLVRVAATQADLICFALDAGARHCPHDQYAGRGRGYGAFLPLLSAGQSQQCGRAR